MSDFLLIYALCKNKSEAKTIGRSLLEKKLCVCVNILPKVESFYFWPPKSNKIESSKEAVLLIKTLEAKYEDIEKEIIASHSYEIPCIFAMKPFKVFNGYNNWLKMELKE